MKKTLPLLLVLAGALVALATPAAGEEIPDTPEPWLYAVAIPPVEPVVVAVVAVVEPELPLATEAPVATIVVPPVVAGGGAEARQQALTLPASDITESVYGESVRVVAWYADDSGDSFVFEREDGTRAVVVGLDRFGPVYELSDNPCADDVFGTVTDWTGCEQPTVP